MWPVTSGGGHLNNKQAESFAEAGGSLAEAEPSSDTWCLRSQSTLDYCSDGVPRWLEGLLLQRRLDWASAVAKEAFCFWYQGSLDRPCHSSRKQ